MKVEVNKSKKTSEVKFPCLMESHSVKGLIVLMTRQGRDSAYLEGVCLADTHSFFKGYISDTWTRGNFVPFGRLGMSQHDAGKAVQGLSISVEAMMAAYSSGKGTGSDKDRMMTMMSALQEEQLKLCAFIRTNP